MKDDFYKLKCINKCLVKIYKSKIIVPFKDGYIMVTKKENKN